MRFGTEACLAALLFVVAVGCDGASDAARPPPAAPPPSYGQGYPPYGQGYGAPNQPAAPYGQPGYRAPYGPASGPYPAPGAPGTAAPGPIPPGPPQGASSPDPLTMVDVAWLRSRAAALMQELVQTLPDAQRTRVDKIPLAIDDTPGEVNAFAACARGGAVMVVTDGLLHVAAYLSRARANDEVFGTRKVDEYIAFVARTQQPNRPLSTPGPAFFDGRQEADPRRVARQHDVFDELLGFVLGHELGHHYLGHLPCTGSAGPFGMGEIARGLSSTVPLFNQPNEIAADVAGTNDLLRTGARRPGYHLTEGGALLLMQFFSALDQMSPVDILFGFERTHPPPAIRIPVIQQAAAFFRTTGGATVPVFGF